ncbi:hypothetical protein VCRA2120E57_100101 [Vibrio crassostreae]|nr:hypothetical protein VCRA2120E57_100101 [Vibrio crassostreae]
MRTPASLLRNSAYSFYIAYIYKINKNIYITYKYKVMQLKIDQKLLILDSKKPVTLVR